METNTVVTKSPRDRELKWMEKNKPMLDQLKGQWIVVEGEELIASSPDIHKIKTEVQRRGIKAPFLVYVPEQQQVNTVNLF